MLRKAQLDSYFWELTMLQIILWLTWYGLSGGPMMVACQWKRSSPTGPAEHCAGGSRPKSCNSWKRSVTLYRMGTRWSKTSVCAI